MIEGRCWALLSLLRAVAFKSPRLFGQSLASECRLSQAHRSSTGFKSGAFTGKTQVQRIEYRHPYITRAIATAHGQVRVELIPTLRQAHEQFAVVGVVAIDLIA